MAFDTLTIRLTDGIKGAADYSPNKLYELTAILSNPRDEEVAAVVALIVKTGEGFLGRSAPAPVKETQPGKLRASKAEATPASDPLGGAVGRVSEPGTEAGTTGTGGVEPTFPDDPLTGAAEQRTIEDIAGMASKEITDDELIHAVMQRNEALKNAAPIRALVETFNPSPGLRVFKATEIEQSKRPGFLVKLGELTA